MQIQSLSEYEAAADEKWGERPIQMIRAAARGAMIRAHGKRTAFGVEYTKQRRLPVEANEVPRAKRQPATNHHWPHPVRI